MCGEPCIPDLAYRRAEELSKGNQQKVQFIAAILHGPDVLLMDEPFTGLDPVNLAAARRLRGAAQRGPHHRLPRPTRWKRRRPCATAGDRRPRQARGGRHARGPEAEIARGPSGSAWRARSADLADLDRRVAAVRPGAGRRARAPPGTEPRVVLAAALERGALVSHFEVAEPSLEAIFIELVGPPDDDDQSVLDRGRGLMSRHDPLLPNAFIVARREYVDRVRSKLYRISTVILMLLAVGVAITLIGCATRPFDVDRIAIVADDDQLATGTIATANGS